MQFKQQQSPSDKPHVGDSFSDHISDDLLKRYTAGQLPFSERDSVENHLLICPGCRERLTDAAPIAAGIREPAGEMIAARPGYRTIYIQKTVRVYWSGG